jgi:hypothetical protein
MKDCLLGGRVGLVNKHNNDNLLLLAIQRGPAQDSSHRLHKSSKLPHNTYTVTSHFHTTHNVSSTYKLFFLIPYLSVIARMITITK